MWPHPHTCVPSVTRHVPGIDDPPLYLWHVMLLIVDCSKFYQIARGSKSVGLIFLEQDSNVEKYKPF